MAIVGGGCAGVTAAFELSRPEHRGRYEVTVYQLGWRLGGKGASGRGPSDRIEEHGLHLWMGFYENAFRLMRECYEALDRDPARCPIATWRDAFVPDNFCGVMDRAPSGRWSPWVVAFPPTEGMPGDPFPSPRRWTVADYLRRCVTLLRTVLQAIQARGGLEAGAQPGPESPAMRPGDILGRVSGWLRYGGLATLGAWLEAMNLVDAVLRLVPSGQENLAVAFHDAMARAVRSQLDRLIDPDDELRRLWEIVDLVLAVIRGSIRFRLLTDERGFDAIDDYDCREWLRLNGASERALNGAFLRALYDLAFAYEGGDVRRPRIAAGQALRGSVRAFFTYRGAFFWKMQAGMGDVVFAPFYEVMRQRGVKFEFFHKLTRVKVAPEASGDRPHVTGLEFDVQARPRGAYDPLVDVGGLPCWPSEPDWQQLENGDKLRREGRNFESAWDPRRVEQKRLAVGEDFDLVVLAVGGGAVPEICQELIARSARWRTMSEHLSTVSTQALQLWLSADVSALGWNRPPINISGFVEPFDTWADMRQLIPRESFSDPVKAVAYFCSVLPDPVDRADLDRPDYPALRYQEVLDSARRFLEQDIRHLWPRAIDRQGRFRWDLLVPAGGAGKPAEGPARLATQYWRANVEPSDRYSLSLPGSLQHRLSPLDDSFDNLTVAGDWTDSGFNEGCVEAAVMSGLLAAHAISGTPALEDIIGFDHP